MNDVGADAARRELGREVVDVLREQPLRVQVGGAARVGAGLVVLGDVHQRRGGAGGDDRGALAEVRQRDLDGVDGADQVGVHHVDPGLHVGGSPFMPAIPACATTMSSLPSSAMPSSSADFSWPASRTSAFAVTTRCPVFSTNCGGLLEVFRRGHRVADGVEVLAQVDRDDVGAFLGEPDRVAAALSARGAGDECDFPLNASH